MSPETTPTKADGEQLRENRRSSVRVRVTYFAAGFLFLGGAGMDAYLLLTGSIEGAKEIF